MYSNQMGGIIFFLEIPNYSLHQAFFVYSHCIKQTLQNRTLGPNPVGLETDDTHISFSQCPSDRNQRNEVSLRGRFFSRICFSSVFILCGNICTI